MRVDAWATRPHYLDHGLGVWSALPEEMRGIFWVASPKLQQRAATRGIETRRGQPKHNGPPTLVASADDLTTMHPHRPAIYLEHGAGQNYQGDKKAATHGSYSGGSRRRRVALFLAPNETVAARERAANPDAAGAVVGCPKLDRIRRNGTDGMTLAFTTHWDCYLCPETRSAYPAWKSMVRQIAQVWPGPVLGHGHPRAYPSLVREYEARGIEPVAEADEVLTRADVLVFDNTSLGYEAAAVGIPTVVLNAPWYRRSVSHGLRFWDEIPGPELDPSGDGGIEDAETVTMAAMLAQRPQWRDHSAEVSDRVFPAWTRGQGGALAAKAIVETFG